MKFQYDYYIGSHLGEYIPEICVQPALNDPDEYYVQGWEGFYNTFGATTITNFVTLRSRRRYYYQDFEVTLNATHLKSCLDIKYSNISRYWLSQNCFPRCLLYSSPTLYASLIVLNTCKSITQVWHAGL